MQKKSRSNAVPKNSHGTKSEIAFFLALPLSVRRTMFVKSLLLAAASGAALAAVAPPAPTITAAPELAKRQNGQPEPLYSYSFAYDQIPYKVNPYAVGRGPQSGYNICNSTTEGPDSQVRFALWPPSRSARRVSRSRLAPEEGEKINHHELLTQLFFSTVSNGHRQQCFIVLLVGCTCLCVTDQARIDDARHRHQERRRTRRSVMSRLPSSRTALTPAMARASSLQELSPHSNS